MDLTVVSTNLRRLRVASGKSQEQVANDAGLSRHGYRKIENGETSPRFESLMRIARSLDIRVEELLTPVRPLSAVRFRARKKMTSREALLAVVGRQLDDYNALERLVGEVSPFTLCAIREEFSNHAPGAERAQLAAARARAAMNLGEELIRDICGLLEEHGVKVFTPEIQSTDFFGLSIAENDGGPAVVVNTYERISVERWIFTAAHELGHLLLHLDAYDVQQTEERQGEELEADVFASHFLMPEAVFARELADARGLPLVDRVFKLKRIFRVSYQTVLYRMSVQLETKARGQLWSRFYIEHKRRTGRSLAKKDEPFGLLPNDFHGGPPARSSDEPVRLAKYDFMEDGLSRLARRALEEQAISMSRAAEILGLSLKDMRNLASSWLAG